MVFKNCCVKSRISENDNFEVMAGSKTAILKSPKKFKIGDVATTALSCPDLVTLEEIKYCSVNQYLNIVGKILSVSVNPNLRYEGKHHAS